MLQDYSPHAKALGNHDDIVHYFHNTDSIFNVWMGGYSCSNERVALLVCLVRSGYHSVSKYQWYKDSHSLVGECHPILYVVQDGMYKCQVYFVEDSKEYTFTIKGIIGLNNYKLLLQVHC